MDLGAVTDFLKKAHAMVEDPTTDSVISWSEDGKSFIVWHPAECCRNHLPRLLGITDFLGFHIYVSFFSPSFSPEMLSKFVCIPILSYLTS